MIDSQVVKTARVGGPQRGYDEAKRMAGRKRHLLMDPNRLVLAARVHSAGLPDRDGGRRLLDEGQVLPRLELFGVAQGRRRVHGRVREWLRRQDAS